VRVHAADVVEWWRARAVSVAPAPERPSSQAKKGGVFPSLRAIRPAASPAPRGRLMPIHPDHPGVDVRPVVGVPNATFSVRVTEPGGGKRRRSFDSLTDALDFQAKHRSDKR
jgi:hypothetical protein